MPKTVITYGSFDLFHIGHVNILRRLRTLGDRLVVGLSTDEFNKVKGKQVVMPYDQREEILLACRYVDGVFPERNWDQKVEDIRREQATIFAMGDDWAGKFDFLSDHCEVLYLPRTSNVSSTEVKQLLKSLNDERINELKRQIEHLARLSSAL